ncbi:MAG: hypothetical protein IJH63_00340 [Methanobrevibacter sp.]|nr:hypothetical protein [Methanosphaera sp.]MBR0369152.1 hypothetical protein [Methanobrevibacter sp.]
MIPPVKAIRRVLFDNVRYNGEIVPVIKRTYPKDETPCITVDDSGGSAFMQRHITNEYYPLDNSHPQFDEEDPFKLQSQQVLREVHQGTVNVNVWCDDEFMREDLITQVEKLFKQAQSDYYLFCDNYRDSECAYTGGPCMASVNNTDKRGVKGQCPNPELYNYKNIFTTYNLIRSSFIVNQPFTLDDLSKTEPVLRSVFRVSTGYYVDHIIGGHISNNVESDNPVVLK